MKTWYERSVEYAGDLDVAAQDVISHLDDDEGVVINSEDFYLLVREKAKEHNVGRKDLLRMVREHLS